MFLLGGRHQADQDLAGGVAPPQEQVPQITGVLHFVIIVYIALFKIVQHAHEDPVHVRVHQLAVRCRQHIVGAAFFMKPEGKGAVFILIAE